MNVKVGSQYSSGAQSCCQRTAFDNCQTRATPIWRMCCRSSSSTPNLLTWSKISLTIHVNFNPRTNTHSDCDSLRCFKTEERVGECVWPYRRVRTRRMRSFATMAESGVLSHARLTRPRGGSSSFQFRKMRNGICLALSQLLCVTPLR